MTNFTQVVSQVLDPYARQARLAPALIVLLPLILLVMVWFPASWTLWGTIISVACSCGLIFLLAQIARDRGKRLEPALFAGWGGKPSVALMRHRDLRLDVHTKDRYRAFLASELKLTFPTAAAEDADPNNADQVYDSATAWLLTRTRDTQKFSLLFRENISYGFRRNLWGLKPIGIVVSLGSTAVSSAAIIFRYYSAGITPSLEVASLTIIAWIFLIIWLFVVTRSWVRVPADAYGLQLLAACDMLGSNRNPSASGKKR
jgi:hypothetical protein